MEPADDTYPETELPSCSGCRKRKLKCSRKKPACSNCERLQTVERALFGQAHAEENSNPAAVESERFRRADIPSNLEAVLSTLAGELQRLNQNIASPSPIRPDQTQQVTTHGARKRKRREELPSRANILRVPVASRVKWPNFPTTTRYSHEAVDITLDDYFSHVQPWIPMIREASFRTRVQNQDKNVTVIVHAMMVATNRYGEEEDDPDEVNDATEELRKHVLLAALDGLTLENLQALIIIAFTDIGDGHLDRAWPIIASLTRTVEYMKLSVETEDSQQRPAVLPSTAFLAPPRGWIEEEERRRVFWNVFILDRFSSVLNGLPICGGRWYEDDPAVTPYFGIWDRSRAKIGNSITFLPDHYPSPPPPSGSEAVDPESSGSSSQSHRAPSNSVDMSMVGAFAYYVESIESLSQITTYFLKAKIDFNNRQEVSIWLTRFKELDLRLVHWKMYLPQQWKDSGVSREIMPGVMDPNMTVANATHNTSMILLHQRIAYPDAELSGVRLPSLCSADTCYNAAVETANITTKYLEGSGRLPVSPQLGLCAFVSGRVLLVHSRYYGSKLADEFGVLVENLGEMARRWAFGRPLNQGEHQPETFFSQLAASLNSLCRESGQGSGNGDAITRPFNNPVEESPGPVVGLQAMATPRHVSQGKVPDPTLEVTSQFNPAAAVGQAFDRPNEQWQPAGSPILPSSNARGDELSAISQILMNNDFLEMDRIISFEDMMSAGDLSHAGF
ncbi:hypothetical protein B0T10DRAFT_465294 [Thelonectria olida]|uniref:Zn(2)-C6 fungal-type domain-containing protein n=1 Tax=Thelonectria olida TaxID=1576542 RepID=A0A9P8VSF9_9HYPO|nr:hypothetical protein B0T10DRAFT_465294 [Thelonectria olida]